MGCPAARVVVAVVELKKSDRENVSADRRSVSTS